MTMTAVNIQMIPSISIFISSCVYIIHHISACYTRFNSLRPASVIVTFLDIVDPSSFSLII